MLAMALLLVGSGHLAANSLVGVWDQRDLSLEGLPKENLRKPHKNDPDKLDFVGTVPMTDTTDFRADGTYETHVWLFCWLLAEGRYKYDGRTLGFRASGIWISTPDKKKKEREKLWEPADPGVVEWRDKDHFILTDPALVNGKRNRLLFSRIKSK
jgi:hypothetical protein